jgi:hypothetical protein
MAPASASMAASMNSSWLTMTPRLTTRNPSSVKKASRILLPTEWQSAPMTPRTMVSTSASRPLGGRRFELAPDALLHVEEGAALDLVVEGDDDPAALGEGLDSRLVLLPLEQRIAGRDDDDVDLLDEGVETGQVRRE